MHFSEQRENVSFWKVRGSELLGFLKSGGDILSSRQSPVDILPVLFLKILIFLAILKKKKKKVDFKTASLVARSQLQ